MVILAIDYGTKNIGLAISDETGLVAGTLPILHNSGDAKALNDLADIVMAHKINSILLGVPMQANESKMARNIRTFGEKLQTLTELPVKCWDESFSSQTVEKTLRGKAKKRSDSMAAQLLLQEYLDFLREKK
jgi:putative Holliday junction resolvase